MFELNSQIYVVVIVLLTILLVAQLIQIRRIQKRSKDELEALSKKTQQQRVHDSDVLKKEYQKQSADLKEKAETAFAEERSKTDRVLFELEREREISKIASTVSTEQARKIQFFSELAQEFRAPLINTMESLENILAGSYGKIHSKTRKQLELLLRNTRLLVRGMDQFHDISHLQLGKMEIVRGKQELISFLREIIQSVAWYAEKKKINLRLDTDVEEMEVFWDVKKIAEVLYHLLSNAFKFTQEQGKILIAVADAPQDEEIDEDSIRLRIRNTGNMIPEEDMPFLFDPFHRQPSRPRFGLSLVKELISLHGGTIQVRSEQEVGTEFTIILPKGRPAAEGALEDKPFDLSQRARMELSMLESEDAGITEPVEQPREAASSISGRILIVEDNDSLRELMKGGLREFYSISEAKNGMEALVKVHEDKPDLIITDVMMPEMNGLDFCRQVKTDPVLNQIPVILITAKSTEGGRVEGLEAGADAYISKPFGFEELLRKVEYFTKQSITK
ncbi:hybrid sensor histidine kinase/response regulator [bacterium]|nr:hybrid sensor histidine kinase/response regulator [bacterium]MCI0607184.1 hybrid sensor histidine kinase/response regulator [bacterium]